MCLKDVDGMANSEGPDQTAPLRSSLIRAYTVKGAVRSGCTLFAHIHVSQ